MGFTAAALPLLGVLTTTDTVVNIVGLVGVGAGVVLGARRVRGGLSRLLSRLLLALLAVAVGAEVVSLTIFDPRPVALDHLEERFPGLFLPLRGSTVTNMTKNPSWPVHEVRLNADGFRGPDVPATRPAGGLRLVMLGDSHVFGTGLADDETIPAQLERTLAERTERQVEVLNLGQPGWNLWSSLALYDHVATKYDPDILVLQLGVPGDLMPDVNSQIAAVGVGAGAGLPAWLKRFAIVRHAAYLLARRSLEGGQDDILEDISRFERGGKVSAPLADAIAAARERVMRAVERGTKIVAVSYLADWETPGNRLVATIFEGADARFTAYRIPEGERRDALTIPMDGHPTPRAAQLFAAQLADFLAATYPDIVGTR